jgi:hypothetical protein
MFAGKEPMYDPERRARESVEVSLTRQLQKKNGARGRLGWIWNEVVIDLYNRSLPSAVL